MENLLATKLFIPPGRTELVHRPRLIERLNAGTEGKLTLISAPAGFGKTTLVSEWAADCGQALAWLSLDEGDNAPMRFLAYLAAALQTAAPQVGAGVAGFLRSPQPPPLETILTALLNDLAAVSHPVVLVLDDYHVIEAKAVDQALSFLLEHLPPQMHVVIVTREDPNLPLGRLRASGQLAELRIADLRFALAEAAGFLNQVMGLKLSAEDVEALEARTEGWIAGLQLAAISLQGQAGAAGFIRSFTGSHRFVLDYLVEEVLQQQPENVQAFLLRTSILDRMCGPLCDTVSGAPAGSGQTTLEQLERANLFIVPLDNERRWYRYHHLFGDLLRQRLYQTVGGTGDVSGLLIRASQWFEDNGQEVDAFYYAAAAHDVERAARLAEGKGMPLQFRGAAAPVLKWLETLPETALNANPILWVMYASALTITGRMDGVEPKLQAAEAALQTAEPDARTRNLIGHIAAIRALLAANQNQVDVIIAQSQRALEFLHPQNVPVRTATIWKLGIAYQFRGERAAARQAYSEALSISEASGNSIIALSATLGLANIQEMENQLFLAAESYRRVLLWLHDLWLPAPACEAHLGLGRIFYEWNDLEAVLQHVQQSAQLARQIEYSDWQAAGDVLLARLKLAGGDAAGAAASLAEANRSVRHFHVVLRLSDIPAVQTLALIRLGRLAEAAEFAQAHGASISQARVYLAQGDPSAALAVLDPWRRQAETRGWADERLKAMILQALALRLLGEKENALQQLGEALELAATGGFIRLFVDEGPPAARLLSEAAARGMMPDYTARLLAAFGPEVQGVESKATQPAAQLLGEPLSQRELEVLRLIAQGLSNREIGERLFLALITVKGHTHRIFTKLQGAAAHRSGSARPRVGLVVVVFFFSIPLNHTLVSIRSYPVGDIFQAGEQQAPGAPYVKV